MTHFSKKRLEKLMNEQGITYAELSKSMGYSTNIESHLNDPISTDMLNKVSKILNTTKSYLIFEDDAPDNAALLREIILQINKLSICNFFFYLSTMFILLITFSTKKNFFNSTC